ncbi:MAG: hypothetical protein IPJ71_17820 [Bdellovibrionales bacterium]|nr:hypothetical protein [Bdellovibrionales bacterium]
MNGYNWTDGRRIRPISTLDQQKFGGEFEVQLRNVTIKVRVNIFGRIYEEFKGLDAAQRIIIECFGPSAQEIYGSSP